MWPLALFGLALVAVGVLQLRAADGISRWAFTGRRMRAVERWRLRLGGGLMILVGVALVAAGLMG
jgi:hypothetical protein